MRKPIYERNFNLLVKLGILTAEGVPTFKESKKMKSGAFMDLNLDFLISDEKGLVISMAHNFIQNGDVMADPDMEIRIVRGTQMVEALSYRQDALGINKHVYNENETQFDPQLKKELNEFLNKWLNNLIRQGFSGGAAQRENL